MKILEDERSSPLPDGWSWERLGDLCKEERAASAPNSAAPLIGLEHVESGTGRIVGSFDSSVMQPGFAFSAEHVLYGKLRPYLNKVATPDFRGRCTTELIPLRPRGDMDRDFLAWLLRRPQTINAVMSEKTGSRMPRADMHVLHALLVPKPPLTEQKRIVAELNVRLNLIEQVRNAVEAQLEAAMMLPRAYLSAVFDSDEAKTWQRMPLGSVSDIEAGIALGRPLPETGMRLVPYVTVANVKDGSLDLASIKETAATAAEIASLALQKGDLLLTEGGDPDKLGRGTFWDDELPLCIHQNHIYRVRFDLQRFDPAFASYQMASWYGKAYFLRHAKQTTGIATINQKVLSAFPLLAPSLSVQTRVARILLDQLNASELLCDALGSRLQSLAALRESVLRAALGGTCGNQ